MDPQTVLCHNSECPDRGKVGGGNITIHSLKERRYWCNGCNKSFAATKGTPLYRLHKPVETYCIVMTLLSHGCPPQAIVAALGLDERTVGDWVLKAGQHCEQVHKHLVKAVELECVQADELWVKLVGRRVWMAMAIGVASRLWLGGVVSQHRDSKLIGAIAAMVRAVAKGSEVLVMTDGLSSYVKAFLRAWRQPLRTGKVGRPRLVQEEGLLLGQAVKQYAKWRVVGVSHRAAVGSIEAIEARLRARSGGNQLNTAYIERLNATFRARLAPLVRRTRCLARRQHRLEAGMWLVGGVYNYCTPHHSLRLQAESGPKWLERTPAMAAGLTEHIWSTEELLRYQVPLPQWEAPKRRARPSKPLRPPTESLAA